MEPRRRPLTLPRWWTATALATVSDISNTIAQFMPMKAIFILALDDLPSFFPQFLIDVGVTWTALILVGVAAIFAVIAALTKKFAGSIAEPNDLYPEAAGSGAKGKQHHRLTFQEFSSGILVIALLLVASLVSLTFTLSIIVWLLLVRAVMGQSIKNRPRRPPFHTVPLEFQAEFKKFVGRSNLWSTVAAALFTLVFAFPELGITGILIGAIALRRAQTAIGDLGLRLIRDKKPSYSYARRPPHEEVPISTIPLSAPLDFVASPGGKRLLMESLKNLDLDYDRWRVVGQPNRNQMSMVAERSIGGDTVLLRIWATDRAEMRDLEFSLRNLSGDFSPFLSSQAISTTIAGLPGILVRYSRGAHPLPDAKTTGPEAIEWQILWETRCLTSSDRRKIDRHLELLEHSRPLPDPNTFLLPHLQILAAINGDHRKATLQMIRVMSEIRDLFCSGTRLYSTGGAVSPTNLLRLRSGGLEPLDLSGLRVSAPGESWGESANFRNYVEESRESLPSLLVWDIQEAAFRAQVSALGRYASSRNFGVIEDTLAKTLEAFYELRNSPVPQH
jgi:hypothetical protein